MTRRSSVGSPSKVAICVLASGADDEAEGLQAVLVGGGMRKRLGYTLGWVGQSSRYRLCSCGEQMPTCKPWLL